MRIRLKGETKLYTFLRVEYFKARGGQTTSRSRTSKVSNWQGLAVASSLTQTVWCRVSSYMVMPAYVRSDNMASIPNSESSFTESISRPRPVSPNMQSSKANYPPGEITPSTSFSAPSSQELLPERPETLSRHILVQQPEGQTHVRVSPLPSDLALTPQSPIPASEARKVPNKRMANGEVKQATQSPLSPIGSQMRSNNSSVTSRNIQISEASFHYLHKKISSEC